MSHTETSATAASSPKKEPVIIQGGMGVAVSDWRLARSVSLAGQLGVVSGTAMDTVLVRRLQLGDPDGQMRHALSEFPYPEMAKRIIERYFINGGKADDAPFAATPVVSVNPTRAQLELVVAANFVEVFLAKEDHDGLVGVNFLEKIQTPTLPSLFGAMLAGVDYVLMGAGIPRHIPGVLDKLAEGLAVEYPLYVLDTPADEPVMTRFDPMDFGNGEIPWLNRPKFLAIVSSATLASMLAKRSDGRVDGFIVEGASAGGHNAPPRGKMQLNKCGEPIYGKRDAVDLDAIAAIGLPFWLAGSYGSPDAVRQALATGASGVQVGTAFAFSNESGLLSSIKHRVIKDCKSGSLDVLTDPLASPTGFPFKVLQMEGTVSEESIYQERRRLCDLGFLRQAYRKPDGATGWRCPGEPTGSYVAKGGDIANCAGRKCVCNGLVANIGLAQRRRDGSVEPALVTCGDDVQSIVQFLATPDATEYSAPDVVRHLLSGVAQQQTSETPAMVAV
ncbi:nitronate monooxygenase [Aporhodopirellula aestuarii]|uniref:Nitronate monooxygenase n=1 Tax=Aporhodopirellula aestuarii TaxID=2950107 RepID=A0ABT0UDM5_9BACT|nr:nitronate monooxygenase [Aporhodopirellula aestuarii]MCM2375157.1 nitronate monooxygenase [Aporhodopirellula aestuarii]